MKVAAYQAPLLPSGSPHARAIELIRQKVDWCDTHGVSMLCCPEAVLGGLADYAARPEEIALERGELNGVLAPIASETVTTIVGFTEASDGRFYNSAAIVHRGAVTGIYRKRHPAIRRSIYAAGDQTGIFCIGDVVVGILICNDSNDPALARDIAMRGAAVLFVPTNNALPPDRADVVAEARGLDMALALVNRVAVVRADVSGRADGLVSYGTTGIVAADGSLRQSIHPFTSEIVVADLSIDAAAHS
jgi:5-aminopentanamidase